MAKLFKFGQLSKAALVFGQLSKAALANTEYFKAMDNKVFQSHVAARRAASL